MWSSEHAVTKQLIILCAIKYKLLKNVAQNVVPIACFFGYWEKSGVLYTLTVYAAIKVRYTTVFP